MIESSFNLFRNKYEDKIIKAVLGDKKFEKDKVIEFLKKYPDFKSNQIEYLSFLKNYYFLNEDRIFNIFNY